MSNVYQGTEQAVVREGGGEREKERERAAILFHSGTLFLLFAIVVVVVIFCTLPQNSLMIKNVYILRTAQAAGHR